MSDCLVTQVPGTPTAGGIARIAASCSFVRYGIAKDKESVHSFL